MTALTPEALRQLSEQAQAFRPELERRSSSFLSLAPTTSTSYPQTPKPQQLESSAATSLSETPKVAGGIVDADPTKNRRSSSLSSEGAKSPSSIRFLKLGPVHWGVHPGNDKGDWHDVAIE